MSRHHVIVTGGGLLSLIGCTTDTLGPATEVLLDKTDPTIPVGDTVRVRATPVDADDRVIPGKPATWEVADGSVASVDDGGLVQGLSMGSTKVSATADGITGSTTAMVTTPAAGG